MSQAKLIGIAPQLLVRDVLKTVSFYRDKIGFSIIGLVQDPPVYGMVQRDGFQIHFSKSDKSEIKTNKEYRSISHDFIIWVPEIDAFFEELKSKEVNIVEGIILRPYGSREFVFEDCDGRRVLVGD
jgi:catechol 2,3-dioxygenase-like lactoylglutathione lyase family enzyme